MNNKSGDITTNPANIQQDVQGNAINNPTNKFDNLNEMEQFLQMHKITTTYPIRHHLTGPKNY